MLAALHISRKAVTQSCNVPKFLCQRTWLSRSLLSRQQSRLMPCTLPAMQLPAMHAPSHARCTLHARSHPLFSYGCKRARHVIVSGVANKARDKQQKKSVVKVRLPASASPNVAAAAAATQVMFSGDRHHTIVQWQGTTFWLCWQSD